MKERFSGLNMWFQPQEVFKRGTYTLALILCYELQRMCTLVGTFIVFTNVKLQKINNTSIPYAVSEERM